MLPAGTCSGGPSTRGPSEGSSGGGARSSTVEIVRMSHSCDDDALEVESRC